MLRVTSLKDSFLGAKVHFKRGNFSPRTSKPLVFALHPHAGSRGSGEVPRPGLGLAWVWTSLDKTWQIQGPCPSRPAWVAEGKSNISLQNTNIWGQRDLSMISMYLQPEALHPSGKRHFLASNPPN